MSAPSPRPGETDEYARAVALAAEVGVTTPFLPSLALALRDQIVAFRPAGPEAEVSNDKGTDRALPCRILLIRPEVERVPDFDDLGVRDVFWRVVRTAILANTSDERPWHAGRLRKMGGGRGYFELRPLDPADIYVVIGAVKTFAEQEAREAQLAV